MTKVSRLQKRIQGLGGSKSSSRLLPLYSSPIKAGPQSSYGNNRWEVYSRKLRRNVVLYSNLEYDHWVLIEADSNVETFCEQPLKIKIRLPVGIVTTIFDVWIKWKSGFEEFREVKYQDEIDKALPDSRIARQIQAQKKWCELKNKIHSVVTDKTIRSNLIYLSNWKLMLRHLSGARYLELEPYCTKVLLMLNQSGPSTLGQIESLFSDIDSSIIKSAVFELLQMGRVTAPLRERPLDMNAVLEAVDV